MHNLHHNIYIIALSSNSLCLNHIEFAYKLSKSSRFVGFGKRISKLHGREGAPKRDDAYQKLMMHKMVISLNIFYAYVKNLILSILDETCIL